MKKAALALVLALGMACPAAAGERVFKVAVGAMMSPKETYHEYRDMVDYLGRKLGMKAELLQRGSYAETNRLLKDSKVDLAFICAGPYVVAQREFGVEMVAAPVVVGAGYKSLIIVRKGSPYNSLKDLRGKVFAYTDPDSLTGCWVPRHMLHTRGEDPESFFGRVIYTHSHDNSVEAVAKGIVDGAAVHSLVYHYMVVKGYPGVKDLKVVEESETFAMPPVVAPKGLDPKLKASVRRALLDMHKDPEGRKILDGLLIEKFVPASDNEYASVRDVDDYIRKPGGLKRK